MENVTSENYYYSAARYVSISQLLIQLGRLGDSYEVIHGLQSEEVSSIELVDGHLSDVLKRR